LKPPPSLGVPKFIQLAEVVREEGVKRRRRKVAEEVETGGNQLQLTDEDGEDRGGSIGSEEEPDSIQNSGEFFDDGSSVVPESTEGLNLEVVLHGGNSTPTSGLHLLLGEDCRQGSQQDRGVGPDGEATKLLNIQKQVGFNYIEADDLVINVLKADEVRDRKKKEEWEQNNGF
jgi:hypothetical protein